MVYHKFVSLAIAVLITHCNSLVLELKEAEAAVKCRILLILVLLYVDNTILAEDDKVMKQVWVKMEWCDERAVVEKVGVKTARGFLVVVRWSGGEVQVPGKCSK